MRVKIINKQTEEFIIKEVLEFTEMSITEQAGMGKIVTFFNPEEYEIKETKSNENTEN